MAKKVPSIALVGRPNVGKSALFNRILGRRVAIVDSEEGITRDRICSRSELFGIPFDLVDTGGLDRSGPLLCREEIYRQAEQAMDEASALIMVVDGQAGVTERDGEVARLLRKKGKPLFLAVNKVDGEEQLYLTAPFYSLGIEPLVAVSALQGRAVAELLQEVLSRVGEKEKGAPQAAPEEEPLKVALVGRPNVGKSTLLNSLISSSRCIVSPIPGTTRDAVDIPFTLGGDHYLFIDTAGVRQRVRENVDKFAALRTEEAITRSHICLLVLDAAEGITMQDKRIAARIEEEGKGCVVLLNKWDTARGCRMEHALQELSHVAPFLHYCPTLCISALRGRNLPKIFTALQKTRTSLQTRIATGELNHLLQRAVQRFHPPMAQGRRARIYYMTQVATLPPRFLLFVNHPTLLPSSYLHYLWNQLRLHHPFEGAPLIFNVRKNGR